MTDDLTIAKLLRAIATGTDAKILDEAADRLGEIRYSSDAQIEVFKLLKHLQDCLHDTVSVRDFTSSEDCRQFIMREIVRYAFDQLSAWGESHVENTFVNTYYQITAGKLAGDDFATKFKCVKRRAEKDLQ